MSDFDGRLAAYLRRALDHPDLWVESSRRIFGGASRHTYAVEVGWGDGGQRKLIVRLDPEASLLESNRKVEFAMYAAMAEIEGVPVPPVVVDEDDPEPLGLPFFVMEPVTGASSGEQLVLSPHREALGSQYAEVLARINTCDWQSLGLRAHLEPPGRDACWSTELDKWERTLDEHDLGPLPPTRAVCRWLRRHPPPAAQRVSLLHGDYRSGNFLFDGDRITAVLDWEMAHLGDPVEDLTWGMIDNWRYDKAQPQLVGGLLARDDLVDAWRQASGYDVEPHALHWWLLLNHVKAVAIWITAGHQFASGQTSDLLMPFIPWLYANQQEIWMLAALDQAREEIGA